MVIYGLPAELRQLVGVDDLAWELVSEPALGIDNCSGALTCSCSLPIYFFLLKFLCLLNN